MKIMVSKYFCAFLAILTALVLVFVVAYHFLHMMKDLTVKLTR